MRSLEVFFHKHNKSINNSAPGLISWRSLSILGQRIREKSYLSGILYYIIK